MTEDRELSTVEHIAALRAEVFRYCLGVIGGIVAVGAAGTWYMGGLAQRVDSLESGEASATMDRITATESRAAEALLAEKIGNNRWLINDGGRRITVIEERVQEHLVKHPDKKSRFTDFKKEETE